MFSWFLFPIVHCESTETLLMFMLALYSTAWLNLFTRTKRISFWNYFEFSENTMLFESRDHLTSSFITWILSLPELLCLGLQIPHWVESINQAPLFLILDEKCLFLWTFSGSLLLSSVGPLNVSPLPEHCLWSIAWLWLFSVPTWSCLHSDIVHVSCIVLALKKSCWNFSL